MEIVGLTHECEQLSEDINNIAIKIQEILSAHGNHSSYIGEGIQFSEYTYYAYKKTVNEVQLCFLRGAG